MRKGDGQKEDTKIRRERRREGLKNGQGRGEGKTAFPQGFRNTPLAEEEKKERKGAGDNEKGKISTRG